MDEDAKQGLSHRQSPVLPDDVNLLRGIIDRAATAMALLGSGGQCLFANRAFGTLLDREPESCIGLSLVDICQTSDRGPFAEPLLPVVNAECRYKRADGSLRYGLLSISPLGETAGDTAFCFVLQITDIEVQKQAEQRSVENEWRWSHALSGADQAVWDTDILARRMWVSPQIRTMVGQEAGELEVDESEWLARTHPDDRHRVRESVRDVILGRRGAHDETYRLLHEDGHWVWIRARGKVVKRTPEGRSLRLVGAITDISHQKEIEEQLADASERLDIALETGGIGIFHVDFPSGFRHWDVRTHELHGVTEETFDGTVEGFNRLLHPDDVIKVEQVRNAALAGQERYQTDYRVKLEAPDAYRHIRVSVRLLRDEDGLVRRGIGACWDITGDIERATELSDTLDQLSSVTDHLQLALEAGHIGTFDMDHSTGMRKWDARAYALHGVTPETYDGSREGFFKLLHPEDTARVRERTHHFAESRDTFTSIEYRAVHPASGEVHHIRVATKAIRRPDGGARRFVGVCWDITEQIERSKQLHDALALLEAVMRGTPDLIYAKDAEGRYLLTNKSVEQLAGRSSADILGRFDHQVFPRATADTVVVHDRHVMETGRPFTVEETVLVDGVLRTYSSTKAPRLDEKGEIVGIIGISRDITEAKAAEAALRRSEMRWQFAVDGAGDGIWDWNLETGYVFYSPRWKSMLGYEEDDIGNAVADWSDHVHPEDLPRCMEIIERHLRGETADFVLEHRMLTKDGAWCWIYDRGKVIERDGAGQPLRCIGTHTDITARKEAEQAILALNQRLQLAVEASEAGIFELDFATGQFTWDERMYELYELSPEDFDGTLDHWLTFIHPDDVPEVLRRYELGVQETSIFSMDVRIRRQQSGAMRHIRSLAKLSRDESGAPLRAVGMNWDITDHIDLAQAVFEEKERLRITLHSIGDSVISTDAQARITFMNPVAEQMTGWLASEAAGMPLRDVFRIVDEQTGDPIPDPVETCLARLQPFYLSDAAILIGRDGERRSVRDSAAPVRTASGEIIGAVLVFQDVTKARTLQQALEHSASHDSLTGLPNRAAFERELRIASEQARSRRQEHVMCFIDLDRFKLVNDTAGHAAGDALLRDVANVMRRVCREDDIVARLGGDEFGLLLYECDAPDGEKLAQLLLRQLAALEFVWDERTYRIGASVGLTIIGPEGLRIDELMSQADIACYTAKTAGRNQVSVYGGAGSEAHRNHRQVQVAAGIRNAIEANRFRLFAQKVCDLGTRSNGYSHYEILLRMLGDDGGIVEPSAFIPASEHYDLMGNIDRWVIRTTFRDFGERLASSEHLSFAINLSANSLNDPFLWPFLQEELERSGLSPRRLHFEITETAVMNNLSAAKQFLSKARTAGCGVILDDFGTGLSSFSYLRQFPVNGLKIDGSFIRQVTENDLDRAIVESINAVGHRLGAITVAEQVEDKKTLELVKAMGIDQAQGYAIAMPQPLETIF
ncbi:MAG TPA: PAS domain-containing protein [Mesorhizobium sp.]|jgi:diguanylate cyclase (GGDEF)-like protein/PAS domain S-box-containing protein|nr:PAS domain-containing protein [Mesorhizobium sp.]HEV2507397.1 PAS domain-containing protein [Mesorhizobium sp.]